jgi:hypothetical protein
MFDELSARFEDAVKGLRGQGQDQRNQCRWGSEGGSSCAARSRCQPSGGEGFCVGGARQSRRR